MFVTRRWLCLWPGLPQLWWRGCWWGLSFAVIFTSLLNVALILSFLWPGWVGRSILTMGWACLIVFWLVSVWFAVWRVPSSRGVADEQVTYRWYRDAQASYLRADWLEAESILKKLLRKDPLDVDVHMMMATLYRRTNRAEQARRALRHLERMAHSTKWHLEIRQERERLNCMEQDGRMERSDGLSEAA